MRYTLGLWLVGAVLWGCQQGTGSAHKPPKTAPESVIPPEILVDAPPKLRRQLRDAQARVRAHDEDPSAYIARARLRGLLAYYVPSDAAYRLDLRALRDYRTAHRLAGGRWPVPELPGTAEDPNLPKLPPIGTGPGSAEALVGAAGVMLHLYQLPVVARLVEAARRIDPDLPLVRILAARLPFVLRGDAEATLRALKKLEDDPQISRMGAYWFALGFTQLYGGHSDEAVATLRRAAVLEPLSLAARVNYAFALSTNGQTGPAGRLLAVLARQAGRNGLFANNYADWLMRHDRLDEARKLLEEALSNATGAEPPMLWLNAERLYRKLGRRQDAIRVMRDLARIQPDHPAARLAAARADYEVGDFEGAVERLEDLTQAVPGYVEGWLWLGDALSACARYDQAAEAYRQATRLVPNNARAWEYLGRMLHEAGKLEQARDALKTALRFGRRRSSARLALAAVEEQLGNIDEARRQYLEAQRLAPEDAQALYGLCAFYWNQREFEKVAECVQRALQRKRALWAAYYWKGMLAWRNQRYDEAIEALSQTARHGNRDYGLLALAWVRWGARGDRQAAARDLAPLLDHVHVVAGLYTWALRRGTADEAEARAYLKRIVPRVVRGNFHRKVAQYVLDRLDRDALLKACETEDQRGEAYFFIACKLDAQGRPDQARAWFERAAKVEDENCWERWLARRILDRKKP